MTSHPSSARESANPSRILLAATPIGDSDDASPRLVRALQDADLIAAEDTRKLLALCSRLGIQVSGEITAVHEHNEHDRAARLVQRAQNGERIVLVSDAGMPTVSDPGYRVVKAAIEAGVTISALPGPSAVLTALAVSGLPSDRFCFEGFPPRREGERAKYLRDLARETRTMIFFESPRRVHDTIAAMAQSWGEERQAVICRELTKTHEEILRGTLAQLRGATDKEIRGEITIVVAGADEDVRAEDHVAAVLQLAAEGMRLKDAAKQVSAATGARANDLYRAALARGED
ncbi:MAG: 16S rRNA (cytidine(1402)-2'-O)-methyltransferase [Actinomycetaceae bacterium]|nr:16S rRNA (cytidine(1402)-2'-O)-methyltransferase [Actinomycetaceae bacterium]